MAIVGGMSLQKQQRLLKKHPNIIVATPGRLWEVFSEVRSSFQKSNARFLVSPIFVIHSLSEFFLEG